MADNGNEKKTVWPNVSVSPAFVKWVKPMTDLDENPVRDSRGRLLYSAVLDLAAGTTTAHGAALGGQSVGITLDESRVDATGPVPVAAGSERTGLVNVRFNPEKKLETFRYERGAGGKGERVVGHTDVDPWELVKAVKAQREAWQAGHEEERRDRAARSFTFDKSCVRRIAPVPAKGGQGQMRGPDGSPSYYVTLSLDGVTLGGRALDGWLMRIICSERQVADLNEGKCVTKLAGGGDDRPWSGNVFRPVKGDSEGRAGYEHLVATFPNTELAAALDAGLRPAEEAPEAPSETVEEVLEHDSAVPDGPEAEMALEADGQEL